MKSSSILLLLVVPVAVSCAVATPSAINDDFAAQLRQRHTLYQFRPGDQVTVQIFDSAVETEGALLSDSNFILPDGRSDMSHVDNPKLAGKTIQQLEEEILGGLADELKDESDAARYRIKIQVAPAEEWIYMVGQFERPGRYPMTLRMTLQDAISTAGGMRVTGDTDWALLWRPYVNPLHPTSYRVDLNDRSEGLFLLPEDQIILSRTFFGGVVNYLREYIFTLFAGSSSIITGAATAGAF